MLKLSRKLQMHDFLMQLGWSIDMIYRANGNFDLFDDDLRTDERTNNSFAEASDYIVDIREYDVPYHVRVMIDLGASLSVLVSFWPVY